MNYKECPRQGIMKLTNRMRQKQNDIKMAAETVAG